MKVSPRRKKKNKIGEKEKKARQRGFREDSPLSDFQTSKKKASSVFSSSDTFVPPLHARRHVPHDAQKAPAAPRQLGVHTYYLPPALTPACWLFTPLTAHVLFLKPGGTAQGVWSPRELQQVCIQQPGCSCILCAGTVQVNAAVLPFLLGHLLGCSHSSTSVHSDFPSAGLHFSFPLSILFSLSICPRGCLFLPISGLPQQRCRCLLYFPCSESTLMPGTAALGCSTSTPLGRQEHTNQVRKGQLQ